VEIVKEDDQVGRRMKWTMKWKAKRMMETIKKESQGRKKFKDFFPLEIQIKTLWYSLRG
jgi:hypothetical protein